MDAATRWRDQVADHFGYLREHGFGVVEADAESPWETYAQYMSSVSAVRVTRSNEFNCVDVHLIRLVDAEVPPYPIWVTADRIDWVLLDSVVEARRRDLLELLGTRRGLSDRAVQQQLKFWADALRTVAPDFLAGDLSAVDDGGALVRQKVAEHKQVVTVWVPGDAPADAVETRVREVQETTPPEVDVRAARYRRLRNRSGRE